MFDGIKEAAKNGLVEVLKLMAELEVPLDEEVASAAARAGQMEVIDFLLAHEEKLKATPREEDDDEFETAFTQKTLEGAVAGGLIKLLNLLKERGVLPRADKESKGSIKAAKKGYLDSLSFVVENGGKIDSSAIKQAGLYGHVEVLDYLYEKGYSMSEYDAVKVMEKAAEKGWIDVLKALRKHGVKVSYSVGGFAAANGQVEILRYVKEEAWSDLEGDSRVSLTLQEMFVQGLAFEALSNNQLDTILWLKARDFPISDFDVERCIEKGNYKHVRWWVDKAGLPWSPDGELCLQAARNGDLDTLKWAKDHGTHGIAEKSEVAIDAPIGQEIPHRLLVRCQRCSMGCLLVCLCGR